MSGNGWATGGSKCSHDSDVNDFFIEFTLYA
jgi:hypothetical protein